MIVDKIYEWLNRSDREEEDWALNASLDAFEYRMRRFMRSDTPHPGRLWVTRFSHPCARRGAYAYLGYEEEPLLPRVRVNFLLGDMTEIAVLKAAILGGCQITDEQLHVEVPIKGPAIYGVATGRIDGLLTAEDGHRYVVEVKKQSEFGFRRSIDDVFGYLSQAHAYMKGLGLDRAIFVRLSGQTGVLKEDVIEWDEAIWQAARKRALAILAAVQKGDVPPRAFGLGKINKQGRRPLELQCRYCGYKEHCWPDVELTYSDKAKTRPYWYVRR